VRVCSAARGWRAGGGGHDTDGGSETHCEAYCTLRLR
jgi:hypothetical protein